jgi:predicted esterase
MAEKSFNEIIALMQTHFDNQNYADGLALASQALKNFPHKYPLINYWRLSMTAGMGALPQANKILQETLAAGCWYAENVLRNSPLLEAMQGEEEFERLAGISQQMRRADPLDHAPLLALRQEGACLKESQPGCPLLLFLHGNQETAHQHLKQWHNLSQQGWLVALPQSSQALWAEGYVWMDYASAADDVEAQFNNLNQQYSIDAHSVVLAGTAMGAEVALGLALSGRIACQGFILHAPAGPYTGDLPNWEPFIRQAGESGLHGVIWMGEADEDILPENIKSLADMLNRGCVPTELVTFPGLGHEYPPDFDEVVQHALKFIVG